MSGNPFMDSCFRVRWPALWAKLAAFAEAEQARSLSEMRARYSPEVSWSLEMAGNSAII